MTFVVLLSIANVVSFLRPFATSTRASQEGETLRLSENTSAEASRGPASSNVEPGHRDSRFTLKQAQVGCEPVLRLKITSEIRQLRLQFDHCPGLLAGDVTAIKNKTNGFEATVFGGASTTIVPQPEMMDGTFIAEAPARVAAPSRRPAAAVAKPVAKPAEKFSSDYISLVPGENEITIDRSGRAQILRIERKEAN